MNDITFHIDNSTGRIRLNRPKVLNALTHEMCLEIERHLKCWAENDEVTQLLIEGEGERAFCVGGDILHLYEQGKSGNFEFGNIYWRDEYRLNALIADYPKPYIALIHGFDMGGGVGVSCHGSHRVVCENTQIALPECSIGLIPDVGSSAILAGALGRLGEYLAATGYRMNAADAIYAGFADYFVPRKSWPDLITALVATGHPSVIEQFRQPAADARIADHQAQIDHVFSTADAGKIKDRLARMRDDFAKDTLKKLQHQCPLSLAVTLRVIEACRKRPGISHALDLEFRFTSRSMTKGDLLEGIRATIVDKDRKPRWRHAGIGAVPEDDILAMMAPVATLSQEGG